MAIDTFFFFFNLKIAENGFWQKKYFPNFFGQKEPYLDVIFYLGNHIFHPPPTMENPLNKIFFILDWEQNKKKTCFFLFLFSGQALYPSGRATKKRPFFAASLTPY